MIDSIFQLVTSHLELIFVGITALATAFLVCVTYILTRVAREQNKTTRDQLRAYIFIESVHRVRKSAASRWNVHIKITNFGLTPAYHVTTRVDLAFEDGNDESAFVERNPMSEGSIVDIPPGKHIEIPLETVDFDHYASAFAEGKKVAFIWGETKFVDAFGGRRWLKFRLYQRSLSIIDFAYCSKGNETSENPRNPVAVAQGRNSPT